MKILSKIRFIPLTIFAATLMLTVKIGDIWEGFDGLINGSFQIASAVAQTEEEAKEAAESQAAGTAASQADAVPDALKDEPPAEVSKLITEKIDNQRIGHDKSLLLAGVGKNLCPDFLFNSVLDLDGDLIALAPHPAGIHGDMTAMKRDQGVRRCREHDPGPDLEVEHFAQAHGLLIDDGFQIDIGQPQFLGQMGFPNRIAASSICLPVTQSGHILDYALLRRM